VDIKFSAHPRRKTVLVLSDFVVEVESEDDAYQVNVLNPSTHEVELSFRVLKKHEELSFRTLQEHLWLPPRLMEKVLKQAEEFGVSVREVYLGEVGRILLSVKQAINLLEKRQGGRER
jgi:uncharacterized protein with GYD domain